MARRSRLAGQRVKMPEVESTCEQISRSSVRLSSERFGYVPTAGETASAISVKSSRRGVEAPCESSSSKRSEPSKAERQPSGARSSSRTLRAAPAASAAIAGSPAAAQLGWRQVRLAQRGAAVLQIPQLRERSGLSSASCRMPMQLRIGARRAAPSPGQSFRSRMRGSLLVG